MLSLSDMTKKKSKSEATDKPKRPQGRPPWPYKREYIGADVRAETVRLLEHYQRNQPTHLPLGVVVELLLETALRDLGYENAMPWLKGRPRPLAVDIGPDFSATG